METDADLMRRTRMGDEAAFARVVEMHKDRLVNYLARLTGSRVEGEEHAQEAFCRLFRTAARFRNDGRIAPLLFRIGTNLVRSSLRRERVRRFLQLQMPRAEPGGETLVEVLLAGEVQRRVQAAIARLPERLREAIVLRYIEGWAHADMARALGCGLGTVKSRIARGRARLRVELAPFHDDRRNESPNRRNCYGR